MANYDVQLSSAMRQNLFQLQKTSQNMEVAQSRLATGKRVQSALDDPINYFAALGHTQRATDLAGRKNEMSEGIQTVKAANEGVETINTLIAAAKSIAQSALASGDTTTQAALADDYNDILDQIDDVAVDSGYKGINLLNGSTETLTVEFNQDGTSDITLTGFGGSSGGLSIADASNAWANTSDMQAAVSDLDTATDTLRTESKTLSSNLNVITARQDFTQGMINVLEDGAANLTNADMNEEGANMLMLQTRQSLGTTSLSLASQAAQAVLRLF